MSFIPSNKFMRVIIHSGNYLWAATVLYPFGTWKSLALNLHFLEIVKSFLFFQSSFYDLLFYQQPERHAKVYISLHLFVGTIAIRHAISNWDIEIQTIISRLAKISLFPSSHFYKISWAPILRFLISFFLCRNKKIYT